MRTEQAGMRHVRAGFKHVRAGLRPERGARRVNLRLRMAYLGPGRLDSRP